MADRTIKIIVEVNDATDGIQKSLLAMDKVVQRMQDKLRAFGLQRFAATVRLIDRVTQSGSRINFFLKSLASKVYNITMRVTDSAGNKIRQIEASLMKLSGRAWIIGINVRDNVAGKIKGLTDGLLMGMGVGMLGTAGIGYGAVNAAQAEYYMSIAGWSPDKILAALLSVSLPVLNTSPTIKLKSVRKRSSDGAIAVNVACNWDLCYNQRGHNDDNNTR